MPQFVPFSGRARSPSPPRMTFRERYLELLTGEDPREWAATPTRSPFNSPRRQMSVPNTPSPPQAVRGRQMSSNGLSPTSSNQDESEIIDNYRTEIASYELRNMRPRIVEPQFGRFSPNVSAITPLSGGVQLARTASENSFRAGAAIGIFAEEDEQNQEGADTITSIARPAAIHTVAVTAATRRELQHVTWAQSVGEEGRHPGHTKMAKANKEPKKEDDDGLIEWSICCILKAMCW